MPQHVASYLLPILRRALELGADEIRFAAGQLPALRLGKELRPAEEAPVRAELVQALHEQCLREGERSDLLREPIAHYEFGLPELGMFHCQFEQAGGAKLLHITPERPSELAATEPNRQQPPASSSAAVPSEPDQSPLHSAPPSEA